VKIAPALVCAAFLLGGCALASSTRARPWRWTETRADYIRRGQVWLGNDLTSWLGQMRSLDLLEGPRDRGYLPRNQLVKCKYKERKHPHGDSPKFWCTRHTEDGKDTFKVKFGRDNGEVYAEVAASRLFWALGFGTDMYYPVDVECTECADDPWRDRAPHPGHIPPIFTPAAIERRFPGVTIEEYAHQGWTWAEFETIDPARAGAPREHTDALKLLAAVVQHRDSKADNQRLLCLRDEAKKHPKTCRRSFLLINDLGSTFGGPTLIKGSKRMELEEWAKQPVWKDPRTCTANLRPEIDAWGGLKDPVIGEEGRQFLGRLLEGLTDAQLTALFTAARADMRGGVQPWVAAFKKKRAQILQPVAEAPKFRCPR
jgi:hypothetical protein